MRWLAPNWFGNDFTFRVRSIVEVIAGYIRDGRLEQVSPSQGVVYDLSLDFRQPLFVYAGERQITSIYDADPGTGAMTDVLAHGFQVAR